MPTFGQVVGRIREDLDRGSNFDTRIKQAVVDAIRFYRSNRLPFNTKRARAVTQPDQEYYPLPLDWIEADYLRLETDGNRDPIRPVPGRPPGAASSRPPSAMPLVACASRRV
jgi:hypothetical protein